MADYIIVFTSVILLAISFMIQKLYQKTTSSGTKSAVIFGIYTASVTFVVYFLTNGAQMDFSWYSFINAMLKSLCCILYTIIGFKIMAWGNVTLYMIFLMSGGMVVPCVWGWLFLEEQVLLLRLLGVCVIVAALIISNGGISKANGKIIAMCISVFFLNGMVSVFSKLHQVNTIYKVVDTTDYVLLSSVVSVLMNVALLSICKKELVVEEKAEKKKFHYLPLLIVLLYSITGGASSVLQLVSAKNLPASVLYPMITGGTTVLSGLFALIFFKEKPTKNEWIGMGLCFVGTCLFL